MALFFETEHQGVSFLLLCALGLLLAVIFDGVGLLTRGRMKPLGDVLFFLVSGLCFIVALFFLRADRLRVFYWIALLCGAILYFCGIRRLVLFAFQKVKSYWSIKKQ